MKRLLILCLFMGCLFITGCGNEVKTVTTTSDFNLAAALQGLNVKDNMEDYSKYDYVKEASLAYYGDINLQMVTYDSSETANKVQETQINAFKTRKSTGAQIKKEKGKNYYKYLQVSNGHYLVSVKVENTLIFCETVIKNKDTIDAVLERLGY